MRQLSLDLAKSAVHNNADAVNLHGVFGKGIGENHLAMTLKREVILH